MQRKKDNTVTLKMIAAEVGCAVSSVSTVLNHAKGNSIVSDATRRKILQAADQLGYRPNFASRMLKGQPSRTIGIYVQPKKWHNLSNEYEMSIFKGVERAAREQNYDLLILNISAQMVPEVCAERLAESRIDGVILIHADRNAYWVPPLLAVSDHVVAIDCLSENQAVSKVLLDDYGAVKMALEHFAANGHSRIGFIASCSDDRHYENVSREGMFRRAIAELDLPFHPEWVFNVEKCGAPIPYESEYCQQEGRLGMRYFNTLSDRPTAVLAYNSLVGISAVREAAHLGIRIPEELSIMGIDDDSYLHFIEPRLSIVDHVLETMGREGAKTLIDLMEGKCKAPTLRICSPKLIPGNTVWTLQQK